MSDSARAWETVLNAIENALVEGTLKPGDHLASERQLAAELGVGRSSVREALRVLEVLGLVRTSAGSGPGAGAVIVAAPTGGMSELLRLHVAAQGFRVADIVHARLMLEASVAADLARSNDAAALATAHALLHAMDDSMLSAEDFLTLDAQFHVALAQACGNEVIASMMSGLRNAIEGYVIAGLPTLPSWDTTCSRLRDEHHSILAAIEAGHPEAAAERMRDHIQGYYAESRVADADARDTPA